MQTPLTDRCYLTMRRPWKPGLAIHSETENPPRKRLNRGARYRGTFLSLGAVIPAASWPRLVSVFRLDTPLFPEGEGAALGELCCHTLVERGRTLTATYLHKR